MAIQAQREQRSRTTRAPIVLVVESNVLVRLALAEYLRDSGYATVEARDTDEAIQLLESSGCDIDVVFSEIDVRVGSMDTVWPDGSGARASAPESF